MHICLEFLNSLRLLTAALKSRWRRTSVRYGLVVLVCCVVIAALPPLYGNRRNTKTSAMDVYVASNGSDRSDGSKLRPWGSLQHAANMVKSGMTVHVAPGTYQGFVTTERSGVPTARIRFVSDVKWGALVRSTGAYGTWTNRGDYVDIVGFDISGDGYGGIINWGSNVKIISNHVHHIAAHGCTSDGGSGIVNANYFGSDDDIIGNVVHDVGEYGKICAGVHGIYHSNLRGHILNNITYRIQSFGIHLWHAASHVVIANNLVFNNHYGGILIGAGDAPYGGDPAHPADYILVTNNIVLDNHNRYGIEEFGATGGHNQYVNNLVYENDWSNWHLKTGTESGTITADPLFINYQPDGSGNYRLKPNSPAVDAGSDFGAPRFDIDGKPRLATPNIGPY
jgi:hypothetical protein